MRSRPDVGLILSLALALAMLTGGARAAGRGLVIAVQPGLSYLVFDVMRHQHLLEARMAAAGAGPVEVSWRVLANGGAINDGVLSGSIDLAATGLPAFITLWAKARGEQEPIGLSSYGSVPAVLVTRNPAVKTVKDFSQADRIALPAVRASLQAILLDMAAEKALGPGHVGDLDALTVSMGHPDAEVALLSGRSEITAHFSGPPFYTDELAHPGMHVVLRSEDIFGGPLTSGVIWTTKRRLDETPALASAVLAAVGDAVAFIHDHVAEAAQFYIEDAHSPAGVDDIVKQIRGPGMVFEAAPRGVLQFADFMHRTGAIAKTPAAWSDLFAADVRSLGGS